MLGIGEAFGNPLVTREYFRMIEPLFANKSVFDFDHIEARIRNSVESAVATMESPAGSHPRRSR